MKKNAVALLIASPLVFILLVLAVIFEVQDKLYLLWPIACFIGVASRIISERIFKSRG